MVGVVGVKDRCVCLKCRRSMDLVGLEEAVNELRPGARLLCECGATLAQKPDNMRNPRIPPEVKAAMIARNEARDALRETERCLQTVLEPLAKLVFEIEGVPFKICGKPGRRYVWRMVGGKESTKLRLAWLEDS